MKVEFTQEEMDGLVAELRPMAIRMAQEIAAVANRHPTGNAGVVGGLGASLVLQNILVSMAVGIYPPGSIEGQEWLSDRYHAVLEDAIERWHRPDLKEHFASGGRLKT